MFNNFLVIASIVSGVALSASVGQDDYTLSSIESQPDPVFVGRVQSLFDEAYIVTLHWTPSGKMGPVGFDQEMARTKWRNRIELRCGANCAYGTAGIWRYMITGLRADNECPRPFSIHIQLDDLKNKRDIFVHESGTCFIFEGHSYITREPLLPNLEADLDRIWK